MMLTEKQIADALPMTLRSAVTPDFVSRVNSVVSDPMVAEMVRDNFMSYTKVMSDGKFKTEDYLSAVTYVSFKLMGYSNKEAYCRTFPSRHSALIANGATDKDISAYVAAYNKGKLVNMIMEQTLVPSWVLNQDLYQKALNTQADLMVNAQSEMVRTTAANSILVHLAKPKEAGPLINIDMRETSGMVELKDTLAKLAQQQRDLIDNGVTAKDIAAQCIIEAEVI